MNRKQIIILWIALSVLLPMLYWGGKTILEYSKEIKFSEKHPSFIPDPLDQQPKKIQLEAKREVFTNFWGFTVFEILSISGLLIYICRSKEETGK